MTQGNWTTPPIIRLTLELRKFILLQQKKQTEDMLHTANRLLQSQLNRVKRAIHGK